jgi:hypothetical protein
MTEVIEITEETEGRQDAPPLVTEEKTYALLLSLMNEQRLGAVFVKFRQPGMMTIIRPGHGAAWSRYNHKPKELQDGTWRNLHSWRPMKNLPEGAVPLAAAIAEFPAEWRNKAEAEFVAPPETTFAKRTLLRSSAGPEKITPARWLFYNLKLSPTLYRNIRLEAVRRNSSMQYLLNEILTAGLSALGLEHLADDSPDEAGNSGAADEILEEEGENGS